MPTVKDRIYVGNTYPVAYDCYEPETPQQLQSMRGARVPKEPTSAIAELWDVQAQDYIQLGAVTTHDQCNIDGHTVIYTVAAAKLATAGDFKLFITISFPDGQTVTETRSFKVQARI